VKIAIAKPDVTLANTAFQAQARLWEFVARDYGYDVTIFSDAALDYRDGGLPVERVRRIGGRFWFPPYPGLFPGLIPFDVLLTADPSIYPYPLWTAIAAVAGRSRLILDTSVTLPVPSRDTWRGRLILRMARAIFGRADRVIVPSPLTERRFVRLGLLSEGSPKVVEMGHPADTALFRPGDGATPESPLNVLSVGKLVPEKGHQFVIQALAGLLRRDDRLRLLIAGEGPYRRALEMLCRALQIAEKVRFLGLVEHDQLAAVFRECQIFVHHPVTTDEWEEYFGVVVVEAMSSGLPVVASDCGAMRHIVPGGAGFIVPQRDIEGLRGKVRLLVEDAALRHEMGAVGRSHVCRRYSLQAIGRRMYERVLSDTSAVVEGAYV
jgi:glycosyltransferase involved in cell wall biosynthesis